MTTTQSHYDPLLHTKVTTVTQRRHSIYRVLSQHIPTKAITEAYRTPYREVADEQLQETIRNLRDCPNAKDWHHFIDMVYIMSEPEIREAKP